ncbi:hypothetical protein C1Y40_04749 [Mycobacterium talmoniae]|uniref:Secreted protein n=1 Tax=Mycobacterium talmoniae TaxID=1858794 RepID=A0A2S8BEI5_9MYCO|nr:hypothetical protein C1Y40_04749 [Mycobacterium talmoniae]
MGVGRASRRANMLSTRAALARLLAVISAVNAASVPTKGLSSISAASISATNSSSSASINSATSPMSSMISVDTGAPFIKLSVSPHISRHKDGASGHIARPVLALP